MNNNSGFLTGYSSVVGADNYYPGTNGTTSNVTVPYNTEIGYRASTTGNITGIYDTSGGVYDAVTGYIKNNYSQSGFNSTNIVKYDNKYFDIYDENSSVTSYNYRILGDATGEMGPFYYYNSRLHNSWHTDSAWFVESVNPWFVRGGLYEYGQIGGQLTFNRWDGSASYGTALRIILVGDI